MTARKKTTARKAAPKKSVKKKATVKKLAARRPAGAKHKAAKRSLKLLRHEGGDAAPPQSEARSRPTLGLVKGGKADPAKRGGREARMKEALAEDLTQLPQAAAAEIPRSRSFRQTDSATGKQMILFKMARARTSILAALQGLQPGSAEQPLGKKKWNVRQMVLHLCHWDRELTLAIEPAIVGVSPEWALKTTKDGDRMNAQAVAQREHLSWDEALRTLHSARQELLAAIESIPSEPGEIWAEGHALGRLLHAVPPHDLHHADIIKRWRADADK